MSERKLVGRDTVILQSRPFQALFNDSDYFLDKALEYHDALITSKSKENEFADQNALSLERSNARACFISSVTGLEAFVNSVQKEFGRREPTDLNPEWLTRKHKDKAFDRWPLKEKIKFLPTICNFEAKEPSCFFKVNSANYELLEELIEIRNSYVHGRIVNIKYKVTLYSDRRHEADTAMSENVWPKSDFPLEIYSINHECAEKAYKNVFWAVKSIITFLDVKIEKQYLAEQEFKATRGSGRFAREYSSNRFNWIHQVLET